MRRGWAIICLIGALVVVGCGKESHPNDPRPPVPTAVTVAISEGGVSASPARVGVAGSGSNISQNEGETEPSIPSSTPLLVSFTVANLTGTDTELEIVGPKPYTSTTILGNGTGAFKRALPTGLYRIRAVGLPQARPATFAVGPVRVSSSNDLLLP